MKKTLITLIIIFVNITAFGQKIAYVSSDYILNKMPEYKSAIEQINQLSTKWNEDIKIIYDEVELMYKEYQTKQFFSMLIVLRYHRKLDLQVFLRGRVYVESCL